MTTLLKKLKLIKQEIKLTVFGYVRQNEDELSLFCNIPSMISYLCLSYYFHGECFEKAGDDIKISKDKTTVTKVNKKTNYFNTSYGKTWIDTQIPQIVEWKFKIIKMENVSLKKTSIYLCLVSRDNTLNDDCNMNMAEQPNFGFPNHGQLCKRDTKAIRVRNVGREQINFVEGDIISMILDTNSRKLYFQRIGKQRVCYVKNISCGLRIKYKMAVSLQHKLNSVSLIDFKCNEMKLTECVEK